MRSPKNRNRGNKNRNNRPSGGNIVNRVFDSNGPDGKVRGTPQQIIDKYTQLHRDAALAGDRVDAENFAQHGEHYTRMLAEAQREIEARRAEQEEQNRARQAERDRERAERLKAQEEAAAAAAGTGAQPDLPEPNDGPVATPEESAASPAQPEAEEAKPKRRARRPRKPKEPEAEAPAGDGSPVEAAE